MGGVGGLKRVWPEAVVFGPAGEPIPNIDRPLSEGDRIRLEGLGAEFQVLDVPGHTEGHIAYLGQESLFCGDTLFAAGCGRVFSGTHEQLHRSLTRIANLPLSTQLYCAHEYTIDNLGCALWVEPDNPAISYPGLALSFVAEVSLGLWLLIKGVKDVDSIAAESG